MHIVRPVKDSDLDALEGIAHTVSLGVVSLSRDKQILKNKILSSLNSFRKKVTTPGKELYFFVLEESKTGSVVGTCGIYAKTGIDRPRYYFHIETIKSESTKLPLVKETHVLHPVADNDGPSELCSLFLSKELRKTNLGELLSRSRFLFISQFPERFDTTVLANLRGVIDKETNQCHFWEGWGKHFLNMEFDAVTAELEKEIDIAKHMLPKYPIYASFLPKEAQYAIGKTHASTEGAYKILKKEGFTPSDKVDLFDGGPFLFCPKKDIRTVKECVTAKIEIATGATDASKFLLANTKIDFRAICEHVGIAASGKAAISQQVAEALQIKAGDTIRFIPLRQSPEGS